MKRVTIGASLFPILMLNLLPSWSRAAQTQALWTGAADFTPPFETTPGYEKQRLGGWGGDPADHIPRRGGEPIDHVILFVHGSQATAADWNDYRAHFQDQGFNDSALWALSYGGALHDPVGELTVEKNAGDLRSFVEAVSAYTGVARVRIVAHSLGGLLTKDMLYEHRPRGVAVTRFVTIASPHGDRTSRTKIGAIGCRSLFYKYTPFCTAEFGATAQASAWRDARVIRDPQVEQVLVIYSGTTSDVFYWSLFYGDSRFSPRDNVVATDWPGEVSYSQHGDQTHAQLRGFNLNEVFNFITDPVGAADLAASELVPSLP